MPNHSLIIIMGHVGHTPERREVSGDKVVTKFSVAVNSGKKDAQRTSWYSVEAWGYTAEYAAKYVQKGAPVFVEGRPEIEEYKGKDEVTKTKVKVTANHIIALSQKDQPATEDGDAPF